MAEKRSLTLSIDADLLDRVRILARERSLAVSVLVAREVERLVNDADAYEAARRQALSNLEAGFHLGDGPLPSRDQLHDR